jgi:predicted transcriptional regulator
MEMQFTPEVQAKLDQMARDAGRQPTEVIEDAVIGLLRRARLYAGSA